MSGPKLRVFMGFIVGIVTLTFAIILIWDGLRRLDDEAVCHDELLPQSADSRMPCQHTYHRLEQRGGDWLCLCSTGDEG